MEMVSNEMALDYRTWSKYICLIILGFFSLTFFTDLLEGNLSYSIWEIVVYIVIFAVIMAAILERLKYISTTNHSLKKQRVVIGGIDLLAMVLFVGLLYLNEIIATPVIYFGTTESLIIGLIASFFIIGLSIWEKTWKIIIMIVLLTLPDYLLKLTTLNNETQVILNAIMTFVGVGIYYLVSAKLKKSN